MKYLIFIFSLFLFAKAGAQGYPATQVSRPVNTYSQNDTKGVWVLGSGAPSFTPNGKKSHLYFDYTNQVPYFWSGSAWVAWKDRNLMNETGFTQTANMSHNGGSFDFQVTNWEDVLLSAETFGITTTVGNIVMKTNDDDFFILTNNQGGEQLVLNTASGIAGVYTPERLILAGDDGVRITTTDFDFTNALPNNETPAALMTLDGTGGFANVTQTTVEDLAAELGVNALSTPFEITAGDAKDLIDDQEVAPGQVYKVTDFTNIGVGENTYILLTGMDVGSIGTCGPGEVENDNAALIEAQMCVNWETREIVSVYEPVRNNTVTGASIIWFPFENGNWTNNFFLNTTWADYSFHPTDLRESYVSESAITFTANNGVVWTNLRIENTILLTDGLSRLEECVFENSTLDLRAIVNTIENNRIYNSEVTATNMNDFKNNEIKNSSFITDRMTTIEANFVFNSEVGLIHGRLENNHLSGALVRVFGKMGDSQSALAGCRFSPGSSLIKEDSANFFIDFNNCTLGAGKSINLEDFEGTDSYSPQGNIYEGDVSTFEVSMDHYPSALTTIAADELDMDGFQWAGVVNIGGGANLSTISNAPQDHTFEIRANALDVTDADDGAGDNIYLSVPASVVTLNSGSDYDFLLFRSYGGDVRQIGGSVR